MTCHARRFCKLQQKVAIFNLISEKFLTAESDLKNEKTFLPVVKDHLRLRKVWPKIKIEIR